MQRQYRTNSSRRQFCRRLFCISGHMRSSAYTPVWLRLDKFVKISYDRNAIKNACTVRNERGIAMEHNHLHDHAAALPAQMPPESQLADVAELFKIFGDLTRVRIIFVLFQHEECVMDIAQKLEMTQSAISHQLRVLKQSRLVTSRREGKTIFYALADSHISSIFGQALEHIQE